MITTQQSVPTLRFKDEHGKGYPDWEEKQLGDIARFSKGKGISKSDTVNNGIVKCILYGQLYTYYGETISNVISSTNILDAELVFSKKNDVVVPASGETALDIASAACVCVDGVALSGDINIIRCQQNGIFLAYYLNNKRTDIARLAQGISVVHLYGTHLKSLELRIPSSKEQQKIAAFLSSVDTKIEQLNQKKALLKQYKKGMMQKLFSQEIRFKDEHGKGYPDWEKIRLEEISTKVNDSYNPNTSDHAFDCVELESLEQGSGQILQIFNSKDQKSIKTKFKAGDVLFGKLRPYLRKYALIKFDGVCTSEIWALRAKNVSSLFLFTLIQSGKFFRAANIQSGSKMPRADWGLVSDTKFSIPRSSKEQQKIANFLSAIDKKIELVTEQLNQARTFKKGLLQQMFI